MKINFLDKFPKIRDIIRCCVSAGLLILAYPFADFWILAWFALVPLMLALDGKKLWIACLLSLFSGVLFFAGTLYWFNHVTVLGTVLIIIYCSLYFGAFAVFYTLFSKRSSFAQLFLISAAWVVLEFIRAHALSGFDWASLGHSQYKNLSMIQIADMTGVFGISFIIVMANVLIKQLIVFRSSAKEENRSLAAGTWATVLIIILVFGYGQFRLNQNFNNGNKLNISVIQGNISQDDKWNEDLWPSFIKRYMILSRLAAKDNPELIIWPETAFPGFLWDEMIQFRGLTKFVNGLSIPVLFGSVVHERADIYYNSAILLSKEGEILEKYDKLHLVPFGEYIPFRNRFPILTEIVPIADFTEGDQFTTFPATLNRHKDSGLFSVLICFEDTMARLARKFVKKGAGLLVNVTNDAWFEDSKAPFLHMQSAVFRTVENRRPLVRAANTGISAFIDAHGRINKTVKDRHGKKTYVLGYATHEVALSNVPTLYTHFGDLFAYFCLFLILGGIIPIGRKKTIL